MKTLILSLTLLSLEPVLAQTSLQTQSSICQTLVRHYTDVWHDHQKLAIEIQRGIPYEVLSNYMQLLNAYSDTLFETAKLMEIHSCTLPENF